MYKNIELIEIGDIVLGHDDSDNQVIDIEKVQLGSRLLYSFNGGSYFVTEEHPFLTKHGWKSINPKASYEETPHLDIDITELKIGDFLLFNDSYVELKSIDWKSAEDQIVYNLLLTGNNTYYADGYLVHNKNRYEGGDGSSYDGDRIDSKTDRWIEDKVPDAFEKAQDALTNLYQQTYTKGRQETATAITSKGKEVGKAAAEKSKELVNMIGKTNLAGGMARQKKGIQQSVSTQMAAAQEEKEDKLTDIESTMDAAETERTNELTKLQTKAAGQFTELEDEIKTDMTTGLESAFKTLYDEGLQSVRKTDKFEKKDTLDWYRQADTKEDELTDFMQFQYALPNATDPGNPTPVTMDISDDFKYPDSVFSKWNRGNRKKNGKNISQFKSFRKNKGSYTADYPSCFIAGTQILMKG